MGIGIISIQSKTASEPRGAWSSMAVTSFCDAGEHEPHSEAELPSLRVHKAHLCQFDIQNLPLVFVFEN